MTVASGVLIALAGLVLVVVVPVARSLLSDEARGWLPHIAEGLIRSAARQLQDAERDRYEEEWLAELAVWGDRPLSAIAKAAHIRWNAREMRASLGDVRLRGLRTKRAMDLLVAMQLLVVMAPLLSAIAALIKLESPGPVLHRSLRVGRDGKPFTLLSFRTTSGYTRHTSEARYGGAQLPQLSRGGALLRRTALDELPQLINVLRGEMSLVGPRPLPRGHDRPDADLDSEPSEARPGLVSPAAVHARPGASYEELKQLDRDYQRTRSLARDLKLLVLSVGRLSRRR